MHLIKITFYSVLFKLLTEIHFSFTLLPDIACQWQINWNTKPAYRMWIPIRLSPVPAHFSQLMRRSKRLATRHKCWFLFFVFYRTIFYFRPFICCYRILRAPTNDISDVQLNVSICLHEHDRAVCESHAKCVHCVLMVRGTHPKNRTLKTNIKWIK